MAATTDAMYNAPERHVQQKFVVYFPGSTLTVTHEDYLVDSSVLEETQSSTENYLGNSTANELSLTLMNENRIFTPTNTASPYYNRMKRGVKIESFVRAEDGSGRDWDNLGTFYVTAWSAPSGSLTASITANDKLYSLFQLPMPVMPITRGLTHKELYDRFFSLLGMTAEVDESLTEPLVYAYINQEPKEFLNDLSLGAMADCFCGRSDNIVVMSKTAPRQLRATLTDHDQITSIAMDQNIESGYDGSHVVCNAKQEGNIREVLSLKEVSATTAGTSIGPVTLDTDVLVALKFIGATGENPVSISNVVATPGTISMHVQSTSDSDVTTDISVNGDVLETVSTDLVDTGENLLQLSSNYVQSLPYANTVKAYVDKIASVDIPPLTVKVRGNPLLKLGDLIRVQSDYYRTDYLGIIIRSTLDYNGGLTGELVLAPAQAFLEV